jgi:alpha-mannosidase
VRPVSARVGSARGVVNVEGVSLGLGALKRCEDSDDLVLRVYEPQGARGTAHILLPEGWSADSGLNLLEDPVGPPEFSLTPFQVRSWRLTKPKNGPSG